MLILTQKGRMYRSGDGGLAWTDITDQLDTSGDAKNSEVAFEKVEVSPADKNVVLAVGKKKHQGGSRGLGNLSAGRYKDGVLHVKA